MKLKHEIKPENLKKIEIEEITLNKDKFGALTFDKANPRLNSIRNILVEFSDLGYQDLLTSEEVSDIDTFKKRLIDYIQRINDLDPGTDVTFNKNVRDQLENEIESFYNNTIKKLRNNLVYLRQEAARKSKDQQSLAEEQRVATQARKQAEEILIQFNQKLDDLRNREKQLESTAGRVGARALGIYFEGEKNKYQNRADKWFWATILAYILLFGFVMAIICYYTFFHEGGWINLSWQEGAGKVVLFATLWYGLSFIVRSYNVNSHLAAVNRHRAAVAKTLQDFLSANPPHTEEIVQNGTEAMFKHVAIGFITKAEKDSGNPILEVANKFINPKTE